MSADFGDIDRGPARVDQHVPPDAPAGLLKPLAERPKTSLKIRIVRGCWQEHTDVPDPLGLLSARGERPRGHAKSGYELPPPHVYPRSRDGIVPAQMSTLIGAESGLSIAT